MIAISDRDINALLSPADLIADVETVARLCEEGGAKPPQRLHLEWSGNTLLTMPAVGAGAVGTKLVSVVPDNAVRGLPTTSGLMVLNDVHTGLPLAILNATALTAWRTGAVAALGVKYMTPAELDTVGIVGIGMQGTWQAIFAGTVRPIGKVFYISRSPRNADRFRTLVGERLPGVELVPCANVREVVAHSRLIIAATPSTEPVLPDEPALLKGKHFISVGSFRSSMQELPDSVYRLAGELAIDSESARHEVGDVAGPLERGILKDQNIFFIGQLITGRRTVDVHRTTAYKTVGMALYDLVAAQAAYRAAKRRGMGHELEI